MVLQVLMAMIAGWINRHQQQVIAYLLEENRTFRAKLGDRRIRFTMTWSRPSLSITRNNEEVGFDG